MDTTRIKCDGCGVYTEAVFGEMGFAEYSGPVLCDDCYRTATNRRHEETLTDEDREAIAQEDWRSAGTETYRGQCWTCGLIGDWTPARQASGVCPHCDREAGFDAIR